MARSLPALDWPEGQAVAVCLTFDVDAEAPWLAEDPSYDRRLSTLSEGRYGVARALPRILALLARLEVAATFYVPGAIAARYPEAVESIASAGHEVGHHGHRHLRSHRIGPAEQRAEIEEGLDALDGILGRAPKGYRSPAWELTPETFALLLEYGFGHDSSCMGDDRPYVEEHGGREILELPVHWSLDDWPYFGWSVDRGGNLTAPADWLASWEDELESARAERRLVTYTMHPEVIGRGYRLRHLTTFIERACAAGDVWWATHEQVAARCR
jgi:peptidoglycan/xylan/chitin deacetylase (PgdA/CDA1 family)